MRHRWFRRGDAFLPDKQTSGLVPHAPEGICQRHLVEFVTENNVLTATSQIVADNVHKKDESVPCSLDVSTSNDGTKDANKHCYDEETYESTHAAQ